MIENVISVFEQVRLLNNRLVEVVEELHADSDLTAPRRAVLEYLHRHGPATVPNIARARNVTRQHIQTISNELLSADLVEQRSNPAHRRSPLLELTDTGRARIDAVLAREHEYMASRLYALDRERLIKAAETLADVRGALAGDVDGAMRSSS